MTDCYHSRAWKYLRKHEISIESVRSARSMSASNREFIVSQGKLHTSRVSYPLWGVRQISEMLGDPLMHHRENSCNYMECKYLKAWQIFEKMNADLHYFRNDGFAACLSENQKFWGYPTHEDPLEALLTLAKRVRTAKAASLVIAV